MIRIISKEKARKVLTERTKKVTNIDFEDVIDQKEKIKQKFKNNGPLQKFIDDLKLMYSLIIDYKNKVYKEIPVWTISAIIAALIYVLSPIDLIPDFIFGLGYIDDGLIVAACLNMIEKDLEKYKEWKKNNIKENSDF